MINIIYDKVVKPPRVVLYAPEGVGKTTFGASVEKPLVIATERGTDQLDVPRVNAGTWTECKQVLKYLATEKHEFKSLVVDTIDWMEKLIEKKVCEDNGAESIDDKKKFPYAAGHIAVQNEVEKFLMFLDTLIEKGIAVYLLAHAKIETFNDPEKDEPIHRWQLKAHKRTTPLYKEWSDCVLFANHNDQVINGKAVGGYQRKIWANHTAARDAKNRYNIPDGIDLDFNELNKYFKGDK